jgi:hypothetical protein
VAIAENSKKDIGVRAKKSGGRSHFFARQGETHPEGYELPLSKVKASAAIARVPLLGRGSADGFAV